MNPEQAESTPLELAPTTRRFFDDVIEGLSERPFHLPCKYFYDARGSQLFDAICELPEYYPTRTERGILRDALPEITDLLGEQCLLVEYGSGSSLKTRLLLDAAADRLAGYVPLDISTDHLATTTARLRERYEFLPILPLAADYTEPVELPDVDARRRVVFFPGSTIGNFEPDAARDFLENIAEVAGPGGGLLIGVDLVKDPACLTAAYNDREGVTARFNLNVLRRINAELGANFDLDRFVHHALYNPAHQRIEMHLICLRDQRVHLGGSTFEFAKGDSILTECSYKYTLRGFADLAREAGLCVQQVWTDEAERFSVQYLTVEQPQVVQIGMDF